MAGKWLANANSETILIGIQTTKGWPHVHAYSAAAERMQHTYNPQITIPWQQPLAYGIEKQKHTSIAFPTTKLQILHSYHHRPKTIKPFQTEPRLWWSDLAVQESMPMPSGRGLQPEQNAASKNARRRRVSI